MGQLQISGGPATGEGRGLPSWNGHIASKRLFCIQVHCDVVLKISGVRGQLGDFTNSFTNIPSGFWETKMETIKIGTPFKHLWRSHAFSLTRFLRLLVPIYVRHHVSSQVLFLP